MAIALPMAQTPKRGGGFTIESLATVAQHNNQKGNFPTIAHLPSVIKNGGDIGRTPHQVVSLRFLLLLNSLCLSTVFIMSLPNDSITPQSHGAGSPDECVEQENL